MKTTNEKITGHPPIETANQDRTSSFYQVNGVCLEELSKSPLDSPCEPWKLPTGVLGTAPSPTVKVGEMGKYDHARPVDLFLAHAVRRERHRIARDLHDHVGQYVVGVMLRLAAIERRIEDPDLRTQLSDLRPTLLRFTDELKAISNGTNLDIPNGAELIPAFSDMIKRWESTVLIKTRFEYEPVGRIEVDLTTTEVLFRVVQEALTNVAKHASDATLVTVQLSFKASELMLSIEDDGPGFAASADGYYDCDGIHYGIAGMRERVSEIGGTFDIRSPVTHRGTCVVVTIPLNHH